jgi:hypothetical protein
VKIEKNGARVLLALGIPTLRALSGCTAGEGPDYQSTAQTAGWIRAALDRLARQARKGRAEGAHLAYARAGIAAHVALRPAASASR